MIPQIENSFEVVGDLLRQQSKRWAVQFKPKEGTWEILDLWHESLKSLVPDSPIPNDSPALTILPADAFDALIHEADRLGILAKVTGRASSTLPLPTAPTRSGDELVRLRALDLVREIVAMSTTRGDTPEE